MKKIKVGAVSYLNTKPLIYGVKLSGIMQHIELIEDYPAKIADALMNDTIDIGLVPIAMMPRIKNAQIVSNFCISAENKVASVCIFSEVPIEQVTTLMLDYQSRTSVKLAQVLLKHYWEIQPTLVQATPNFEQNITENTAAVVIGDRALALLNKKPYVYDLAESWIKLTGLPFVFAGWIANKSIPEAFIDAFEKANLYGLKHLHEVIATLPPNEYDLYTYFTENIQYQLNETKRASIQLFLKYLNELEQ